MEDLTLLILPDKGDARILCSTSDTDIDLGDSSIGEKESPEMYKNLRELYQKHSAEKRREVKRRRSELVNKVRTEYLDKTNPTSSD